MISFLTSLISKGSLTRLLISFSSALGIASLLIYWRVRSSLGWDKKKRTARPKEAGNVRNWLRRNIDSQRYLKLCNYASE
ncbi:MAG: hypothetical protein RLZZ435_1085 [Cyanobacteriota bacterium]